jgi:hypothetical protein
MTTADGSVLGTTKVVDNGPSSVRWDLVIMGDGYQSGQMAQYEADVRRIVDHLFGTPPFDEMRPAINIHRVNVTSTDRGADDPTACGGTGATARTYFDASFCNDGLRRSLKVNDATALATLDDQVPQWNAVLVVVNSTVHGGSGGTVGTCSLAPGAEDRFLHELGHSAFGLADEYETYRGCDSGETDRNNHPGNEPAEVNVTVNTDPATLKWRRFVADPTDVPTTRNADCTECDSQASPFPAGTVGLFEGADKYHCGAFRPEFDCKMRISSKPFCAICRERIRRVLAPHLRGSIFLDQGVYTVQQKSSGRFMDAYQSEAGDFSAVTRTAQNDDTQRWLLTPVGEVYTVQQKSSGRFVDAHQDSGHDFSVVTRTAKNNDAQRWVFIPLGSSDTYTVQQLSSGRFWDAHEVPEFDFKVVTRPAQNNDTQRWMLVHLGDDTYTIQQKSNGRFMDAHEVSSQDFSVVTRTAQVNDTQRWILTPVGRVFNIEQMSNRRLVDAYEVSSEDFSVVTRTPQADLSQSWVFVPSGTDTYTIRQLSSRRFVDAYQDSGHDFAVVTRPAKNNDAQRWVIKPL